MLYISDDRDEFKLENDVLKEFKASVETCILYSFRFSYYKNQYDTIDEVAVVISSKGDPVTLHTNQVGLFKEMDSTKTTVNPEILHLSVQSKIAELYSEYTYFYKIERQWFVYTPDRQIAICSMVNIELNISAVPVM